MMKPKRWNKALKSLLLLCLMVGYALSVSAQNIVNGRVVDEHNQGAEAAIVMLFTQPDSILSATTLTDSKGMFSLQPRKGTFLLCVRMLGYKEIKRKITIHEDMNIPDLQLEPDDIILKNVVITARKSQPMISSSNGKTQINVAQTYLTDIGDALDVLKHSPGISVNNKGDISLSSLGGTAIYVNGKKLMLQGEELSAYLRTLPSSRISKIEISPNPNAYYGTEGAGGIINIILKTTEKSGIFLTTSHSIAYWENIKQNSDITLSYNTNKWQLGLNYNHSIGHHAMDYGYEKIQNGDKSLSETKDTDKRNTYSAGFDFTWQPNLKNKLSLNSTMNLLVGPGLTETTTGVYQGTSVLDCILKARNDYLKQKTIRYSNSANYLYQPSEKKQLALSADWTHFDGKAQCEQPNTYFSPTNTLIRSDLFYSQPDKDIDIYALLADYKCNPNAQSEWLVGVKTSLIKSNNTFLFKRNGSIDL